MLKRLLRHPALQNAAAWLLGSYLAFALRTTRWRVDGIEHALPHVAGAPCVVAFWHERLPMMPMLWVMARRHPAAAGSKAAVHVLVSRHRDGRFIGRVVRRFDIDVVHGSSSRGTTSRGGAAAARNLRELLLQGDHVGITPDGPRGPRRHAAPGVAQVAGRAGVPVLPAAAQTTWRCVLPSWDRTVVPLPFGRGVVVIGAPIAVPAEAWEATLPAIEAALTAATERADRLCAR